MYRLGILETHPIQYKAPWFRLLSRRPELEVTVFYCMLPDAGQQGADFGVSFQWDQPLLEGYRHRVLRNRARTPSMSRFNGCDTPDIRAVVRDEGFDAFLANGWVVRSCLQLLWACRRYGVPCLVRGESNLMRRRARWKGVLLRLLLRQYSAVLAIGAANREFYRALGVEESRLFFAPYGVDNEGFEVQAASLGARRQALREAWGIPRDAIAFLFCGKFVAKKRPRDVLDALRMHDLAARGRGPGRLHVLMAGDGPLRGECEAFAAQHRLPVTFAGFLNQTEVARAYVAADCLVLPSDAGETWGLVVNEAMACGRPAVVSDQVGCRADLVVPGRTGDVVPCGDCAALAAALTALAADPARLARMGEQAREHVRGYSFDRLTEGTLAAVAHACRRRRPSSAGVHE